MTDLEIKCCVCWLVIIILILAFREDERAAMDGPKRLSFLPNPPLRQAMFFMDIQRVLLVENLCFASDRRWHEGDFFEHQRIGCTIGVYDAPRAGVIGYVVFYLHPGKRVEIVRAAVLPPSRRLGIGTSLLQWPIGLCEDRRIDEIVCDVPEDYVEMQLLLKHVGFRWQATLPDDCKEVSQVDMYRFVMSPDSVCSESVS